MALTHWLATSVLSGGAISCVLLAVWPQRDRDKFVWHRLFEGTPAGRVPEATTSGQHAVRKLGSSDSSDWAARVSHEELLKDLSIAQELLQPEDDENLRNFGGIRIDELLTFVRGFDMEALKKFMGTGKYYQHALNSRGLQVLRVMLTNRIQDWLRSPSKDPHDSPLLERFHRDGIIAVDFKQFGESNRGLHNLTRLLHQITGFRYMNCQNTKGYLTFEGEIGNNDKKLKWLNMNIESNMDDPQIRMHVDNLMPRYKVFLFPKVVPIPHGPFHYVLGSHRPSRNKMRWVYEVTHKRIVESKDLRFNLTKWSYSKQSSDLKSYNFKPAIPFGTKHDNTLVIADTGGFHFRGAQAPGHSRLTDRLSFGCKGDVMQKNLYKCIADREAC